MLEQTTARTIPDGVIDSLLAKPIRTPQEHVNGQRPVFARLDRKCLARLRATTVAISYAKRTLLFAEGQESKGVYIILDGRTKLSVSSANGRSLVLGFFGPGTVLGLEAAILGWPHMATAEVAEPTNATFMERHDLLRYLGRNEKATLEAVQMASKNCYFLLTRIKAVELAESTEEKLVRFLLGLWPGGLGSAQQKAIRVHISQEAVAQMIGCSRETVTRLLSRFKRRRILDWKRSRLVIRDMDALRRFGEPSRDD